MVKSEVMADHHYRIQGQVTSFPSAFQRQNNKPMPTEVGTEGGACESQRGKRQNQVFQQQTYGILINDHPV